jgi:Nuclease-related domain
MFAVSMARPRRQQYRYLSRSAAYAISAALNLLVAVDALLSGQDMLVVPMLLLLGVAICRAARRSQRLAGRWRVDADSQRTVQHAVKGCPGREWSVRSGVRWPRGGDIDHLVRSPVGVAFAIETKTWTCGEENLRRTAATARRAERRRRRYPLEVVPLCVVRAHRQESSYGDVVVVCSRYSNALLRARAARSGGRAEDRERFGNSERFGLARPRACEPGRWLTKSWATSGGALP